MSNGKEQLIQSLEITLESEKKATEEILSIMLDELKRNDVMGTAYKVNSLNDKLLKITNLKSRIDGLKFED